MYGHRLESTSAARPDHRSVSRRTGSRAGAALALVVVLATGCTSYRAAGLYQSGSAALESGDTGTAISDLEAAAALQPGGSEIQNHLGLAYLEADRPEEALQAFDRAVELDCDNRPARLNRAALRARLGVADDGR
jgi:lipoprotein NlpI